MMDNLTRSIEVNDTIDYGKVDALNVFIAKVLDHLSLQEGHFEFTLVDPDGIVDVNNTYLGRTYVTDVISFNLGTPEDIHGDVYICVAKVEENALELGIPASEELCRVLVHSILHLLDYRDYTPEEQAEMTKKQEAILRALL